MASGGDTWWLWLASSVENCLFVCLPAGRSNFTNENVERSPAKKKKKKRKTKN